ncbi:MAG: T9SS type A sorting domain-containing protein [Ignavibacteriaceae bacterium]|nr:T9SS type A sorting domain-containing protein [Ignavibacteriaceae bacterium]MCW9094268.1 T9SS type A sorting domain-containing protein [Ignavibacteriaceae bacterium]
MKKLILFFSVIAFLSSSIFAQDEVVLQFTTISGYSNNLYIDNISAGNQYDVDVAVISINNIDADTSYAIGSSSFTIAPEVSVTNLGKTEITSPFDVVMTVEPGGYSSTQTVSSLTSGQSVSVVFDDLTIYPSTEMDIVVTSQLAGDENPANDVLSQYSVVLPGVQRDNVLLEEWTNASCAPCAANNPTIDAFVATNFSTIVPVKYHVWWPGNNDPMYLFNVPENTERTNYYGVSGVPNVIMGGVTNPVYPYTTPGSLQDAYDIQMSKATPLEVSVTDTHIGSDSIRTDIVLTIHAPLLYGQYYLRVMAVERWIHYASPPGTNGETDFYDVFRKAYPDITGSPLPLTPGTYNFSFTYPINAAWVDSMMYSIAFVQDDATKKVWCSGKGREMPVPNILAQTPAFVGKPIGRTNMIGTEQQFIYNSLDNPLGGFNIELFEGIFPPAGWQVINPDDGITFEQYDGANGPSLGGSKSVLMDFYSYSTVGASDTMYSRIFYGLQTIDSVKFDYAHAEYPGFGPDRLIVKVSIDGGLTFPFTIFDKAGDELATVAPTSNSFVPTSSGDWATFSYPLENIVTFSSVSVQSPNGGEVWVAGETEDITWSGVNVNDVKIELSTNNGTDWSTIIESTPNTGSYSWVVTAQDSSDECLIRITNVENGFVYDVSDGVFTIDVVSSLGEELESNPTEFNLAQNYPNPFNPSTTIRYAVPKTSQVSIKIYDLTGQEVASLVNEVKEVGTYEVKFDARNLASGVYLYKMIAGDFSSVKKLNVLK